MKSNAYSILANLGPHMEAAQLEQLFQRLQVSLSCSCQLLSTVVRGLLTANSSSVCIT